MYCIQNKKINFSFYIFQTKQKIKKQKQKQKHSFRYTSQRSEYDCEMKNIKLYTLI